MVPKGGGDRPWTAVLSEGLPPRCSVSTCLCVHSSTNWSHRGAIGGGAEGVSFATASRAGRWKGESRRLLLGPFHRHPALEVVGVNLTTRLPVPGNEDGRPWRGTNWTPPANELSLCWLYTTQSSKQIIPSDGDDDAQGGMMDLHLLLHSTYSSSSRTHTHTHTPHTQGHHVRRRYARMRPYIRSQSCLFLCLRQVRDKCHCGLLPGGGGGLSHSLPPSAPSAWLVWVRGRGRGMKDGGGAVQGGGRLLFEVR